MLGRKIVNIEFIPDAWKKKSKTRTHSRCLEEK
jgi:hypothetical protein